MQRKQEGQALELAQEGQALELVQEEPQLW